MLYFLSFWVFLHHTLARSGRTVFLSQKKKHMTLCHSSRLALTFSAYLAIVLFGPIPSVLAFHHSTTTTTSTTLSPLAAHYEKSHRNARDSSSATTTRMSSDSTNTDTEQIQREDCNSMRFGKFIVPSKHIFFRSQLSAGFVNLRPIVNGHVLVVPERVVPRLSDLTNDEYTDLWQSVRVVQNILADTFQAATAFNVAVQDGASAGQSVPLVHVHILPRVEGDLERNDDVYDELEVWAPREGTIKPKTNLDVPNDEDRKDRTPEEMAEEADLYRKSVFSKV